MVPYIYTYIHTYIGTCLCRELCFQKIVIGAFLVYWCHMASEICVDIGSGNGLLRDSKPLPELILINDHQGLAVFTSGQFHRKCATYLYLIMSLKITDLRLQLHFRGSNEVNCEISHVLADVLSWHQCWFRLAPSQWETSFQSNV